MKYKVKYKGVLLLRNNRANWFIYFLPTITLKKGGIIIGEPCIRLRIGFLVIAVEFLIAFSVMGDDECCGNCEAFSDEDCSGIGWCNKINKLSSCYKYCSFHKLKYKKEKYD